MCKAGLDYHCNSIYYGVLLVVMGLSKKNPRAFTREKLIPSHEGISQLWLLITLCEVILAPYGYYNNLDYLWSPANASKWFDFFNTHPYLDDGRMTVKQELIQFNVCWARPLRLFHSMPWLLFFFIDYVHSQKMALELTFTSMHG